MKRVLLLAVTMVMVFSFNCNAEVGVSDTEILIGVIGIYTGPVSYLGDAQMGGFMVFDAVNQGGGIFGRKIVLKKEDTAFSPAKTIAAVKKLAARDNVFALWGTAGSSPALAARPVVDEAKIPWVNTTDTDRKITKPLSPYIFTNQESSFHEATGIAKYVVDHLKGKRICIIHDSTGYGMNQSTFMVKYFDDKKISTLARETYNVGDVDFSSQLLKIREQKPDVTIISGYSREIGHIARQAHELGLKTQFVTVAAGSEGLARDIAGKEAYAGLISANCLEGVTTGGDMKAFEGEFAKAYPEIVKRPNRPSLNDAICYHAAKILVEGLKRSGKNLTRAAFMKSLESIKNYDSGTMMGTYSATEHCGLTWVNFQQWQKDGSAKMVAKKIESQD